MALQLIESHFLVLKQSETRPLVIVAGFIHDLSDFMDDHPGGRSLLAKNIGKDATTAFFGGVYDHSNAAHNVSICHPVPTNDFLKHSPPLSCWP